MLSTKIVKLDLRKLTSFNGKPISGRDGAYIPDRSASRQLKIFSRLVLWTLTAFFLTHSAYDLLIYNPVTEDQVAAVCRERRLAKIASKLPGFNPKLDVLTWMWQPSNVTVASKTQIFWFELFIAIFDSII